MPSPANTPPSLARTEGRVLAERVLRGVGLAALVLALWRAWTPLPDTTAERVVRAAALPRALPLLGAGTPIAIQTDSALDAASRAWLGALRQTGTGVRWGGRPLVPTALSAERSADPSGGVLAYVAAPIGSAFTIGDSVSFPDTSRVQSSGTSIALPEPVGDITLGLATGRARVTPAPRPAAKQVVVLARAGWEGKFVAAALEERGFTIATRFSVRPDTAVRQGIPTRFDTAQVGVVVAVDATAAPYADGLAAFVQRGGGVILGPDAARATAFAGLRTGTAGPRLTPELLTIPDSAPRRALPLEPITALSATSVAIERRGALVAVAARRVGIGRVVQVGYDDTWRWRMTGPEGSEKAHRRWWAGLVAAASPQPIPTPLEGRSAGDAPAARMVAALGPADPAVASLAPSAPPAKPGLPWWWGAVALAALLGEWASRRLRGAP